MGIVIKQGIQTTAASYIGVVLGFVSFLFMFPLVLTKGQIGLIRVLEESTSMLATLAMAGTPNVCIRFFPYFRDKATGHNGFLWLLLAMPTAGVIVAAVLLWVFQATLQNAYSDSPLLLQYWDYILPLTAFTMYFLALETYCKSNFFAAIPTLFKEAAKRIVVIVATLLLWFGVVQFDGFMRFFLGAHLFILFCIIAYTQYIGLWQLQHSPLRLLTKKLRNEIFDFSLFITLGNVGGLLVSKLDTLMLSAIVGLDDTGIYGMAAKLILLIDMPRAAIQQVVFPLLATAFKDQNTAKIAELYQKSALNLLIVGSLLLLLLWCNADAIFAFIPNGHLYIGGKYVILLLGIAKVLDMSIGINYEIIAFSRYYRISAILNLLLTTLAIFINYICIKNFGFIGAAVGSIFTVLLFNTVRGGFLYYKMKLQPFGKTTLSAVTIALSVFGIDTLIPHFEYNIYYYFIDIILHSCVIIICFGGAILYFEVSEDITAFAKRIIKRQ